MNQEEDIEKAACPALRLVSGFRVTGGSCAELCFVVGGSAVMSPARCTSNKPRMLIISQLFSREIQSLVSLQLSHQETEPGPTLLHPVPRYTYYTDLKTQSKF